MLRIWLRRDLVKRYSPEVNLNNTGVNAHLGGKCGDLLSIRVSCKNCDIFLHVRIYLLVP